MHRPRPLTLLWAALLPALPLAAQAPPRAASYISFDDARQVVAALGEILPAELRGKSPEAVAAAWPAWVRRRDAEIRARLAQGDEDSLVNFLLFGTSFTRRPRVTAAHVAQLERAGEINFESPPPAAAEVAGLIRARADDFARALSAPGANERLLFARRVLMKTPAGRVAPAEVARARARLLAGLARALREQAGYARMIEAARAGGGPSMEFVERSKLYRDRGLSSDTSLLPNFAVEESLRALRDRGGFAPGSVRRVAVVGPGLDFTDKQEGYDFYPQQSLQPFAVADSLVRLGLARAEDLRLTTFDLSPRVNDHLARAAAAARRGRGYTLQLPRDPHAQWSPEAVSFWEQFGDRVGRRVAPARVPEGAGELRVRAVEINPALVARLTPVDTNIVLQRLELPEAERFDLVVATNIFVYYDTFDQSLALLNVGRMLRPGGFMLSNNALLELPFSRVRSVGYQTTVYSARPDDGDHLVWYRRADAP